jgi:hypothetical protein
LIKMGFPHHMMQEGKEAPLALCMWWDVCSLLFQWCMCLVDNYFLVLSESAKVF